MEISTLIRQASKRAWRNTFLKNAIIVGAAASYLILFAAALALTSPLLSVVFLGISLSSLIIVAAYYLKVWPKEDSTAACKALDDHFQTQERIVAYQELFSSRSPSNGELRLIEKQLKVRIKEPDVREILPLALSKRLRQVAFSLPAVWLGVVLLLLTAFSPSERKSAPAKEIVALIEENKDSLPEPVKEALENLADALDANAISSDEVQEALQTASEEIEKAEEALLSEQAPAGEPETSIDAETEDRKAEPSPTAEQELNQEQSQEQEKKDNEEQSREEEQAKSEEKKEEEAQEEKQQEQGGQKKEESSNDKKEGKEENESKQQKKEGDSEQSQQSEQGEEGGQSGGEKGQGEGQGKNEAAKSSSQKGEKSDQSDQKEGKSGNQGSSKDGEKGSTGLSAAKEAVENLKKEGEKGEQQDQSNSQGKGEEPQGKQGKEEGSSEKDGSKEGKGAQKGSNKGEDRKESQPGKGTGQKPAENEKREPNPSSNERAGSGEEPAGSKEKGTEARDETVPENHTSSNSAKPQASSERQPLKVFSPDGRPGEGLGGEKQFQEKVIQNNNEALDTRYTEKAGTLSMNPNEARPKTNLKDIILAKPDSSSQKDEQRIPLEYRDIL